MVENGRLWFIKDGKILNLDEDETETEVHSFFEKNNSNGFRYQLGLFNIQGKIYLFKISHNDLPFAVYGNGSDNVSITNIDLDRLAAIFKMDTAELFTIYDNLLNPSKTIH